MYTSGPAEAGESRNGFVPVNPRLATCAQLVNADTGRVLSGSQPICRAYQLNGTDNIIWCMPHPNVGASAVGAAASTAASAWYAEASTRLRVPQRPDAV